MRTRQVLYNCQSQSGPAHLSRARAIHPIKSFKQPLKMLRRNAFTRVLDDDLISPPGVPLSLICSLSIRRALFKPDSDQPVIAIKLNPILNQVRQHLFQAPGVSKNHGFASDRVPYCHALSGGFTGQGRDHVSHYWE